MNTRTYPVDSYQRILWAQPRALKRLDRSPRSWPAIVVRKFPNNPGPPGHWYYVINGAVRRCAVRSDGRRQIVDLMLPRDFVVSNIQKEATIEAIAEETVLASCPGQRVELLAQRDAGSRGSCGTSRFSPFLHHFCSSP
jgi:CRP/FNR family nitrogen fixation transcriptional regulator